MKFVKQHRVNLAVAGIFIVLVFVLMLVRQQKIYENNPGLIPPRGNYDVDVFLTDEQKTTFEADLQKYNDLILNFVPSTGEKELELGDGIITTRKNDQKPNSTWFIEKANALKALGRYTEAIETYNDIFELYNNDITAQISLGELYEKINKPEMAVLQYEDLLKEYPALDLYYYKKLIKLYLQLENPEQAGQRYVNYELADGSRDEELMDQIRIMKEDQN